MTHSQSSLESPQSVEKIAETVLYEGYMLFPYRQSAMKNQQRWTFGGVYPRQYSEASAGDDPWIMQTECLVISAEPEQTRVEVKVRFLQVVDRKVAEVKDGSRRLVEELRVGQHVYRPWEEAIERQRVFEVSLGALLKRSETFPLTIERGTSEEMLADDMGCTIGALVREWHMLRASVEVTAEPAGTDGNCYRFTVRVVNTTPWTPPADDAELRLRRGVLSHTLVSTHAILRVYDGDFVSLLEPPEEYRAAAEACKNIKTWPVLAGRQGNRNTILSSPIILYDYPQVSPETPGDLFDATEIDELLRLSIMTLTDDEKQAMRESDPRSREILETTEALSPDQLMKLHGAVRSLQPRRREHD